MPENNNANFKKLENDPQQDLIQRFQLGQEEAYVQIIEKYNSQVYALANRLLGWPCHVEDEPGHVKVGSGHVEVEPGHV